MALRSSKAFVVSLLAAFASFVAPARAGDPLRVVATIPDLTDIVKTIGGDRVEVATICKGKENAHAVTPRPSHLVALSKADVFVQVGLSLESTFVPSLLEQCGNAKVKPGGLGFVSASEGWTALDVPSELSRKGGDLHPQGNPHLNLDPRGGRQAAERVLAGLCRVEPASKDAFNARFEAYAKKLDEAQARWDKLAAAWKGAKVAVYHQEFEYLIARYGLTRVGAIESRPGIPPTPNHVADLVQRMKAEGCKVILTALWSNGDQVARVAELTGAKVVELPNMCGGIPGTETWIGMMDLVHERLAKAFAPESPAK
jgi:ABC-type Zn uptake system ZnuABC Zn-binding protein ZnuA